MKTGKTVPIALHKNLVIADLECGDERRATETLEILFGDSAFTTPREAALALRQHDGQYIVDGALRSDEDTVRHYQEKYGFRFTP